MKSYGEAIILRQSFDLFRSELTLDTLTESPTTVLLAIEGMQHRIDELVKLIEIDFVNSAEEGD